MLTYAFNPYHEANGGKCADNNFYSLPNTASAILAAEKCASTFVSTVDIHPE